MDDRFGELPKRRSGWHSLFRFWATIFITATAGAALLQAMGPPPSISQQPMVTQGLKPDRAVPNVPAKSVAAAGDRIQSLVAPVPPDPASDSPNFAGATVRRDFPAANASPEESNRSPSVAAAVADAP